MTPYKKKKFLSPDALETAALQVAALAKKNGVRAALLGGYAMQLYGSDRLTGDIDFVTEDWIEGVPHGKPLSFGGEQTTAPNGVPLDLILRDDDFASLYAEAAEKSVPVEGLSHVRVVTPEHLAAIKMASGRDRDLFDLTFLLNHVSLNLPRTRKIIKTHLGPYAVQEFARFVDEAAWKKNRDTK